MYHSVAENAEFSTVSPKEFERQIAFLHKHNFNVVSLSTLADLITVSSKIPPKTICLTFDDGYQDNFLTVLPILRRYNFPATVFSSTAYLGEVFTTPRDIKIKILSAEELRGLRNSGLVDIGSHNHHHKKLVRLEKEQVELELSTSFAILSGIIGQEINSLSYPNGRYDEVSEPIAKKMFKIICTVKPGRVMVGDSPQELKRNSIDSQVNFTQFKGIIKYGRI